METISVERRKAAEEKLEAAVVIMFADGVAAFGKSQPKVEAFAVLATDPDVLTLVCSCMTTTEVHAFRDKVLEKRGLINRQH